MISLRLGSVVLLPALAVGCFLDETPSRDGLTSTAAMSERSSSASSTFMPRDPGTSAARTQSVDAGQPADAATMMDAATQTSRPEAGTAGSPAAPAAAGSPAAPTVDAHVPLDASVAPPADAQVPHSAADAQPPTAAGASGSMPMPILPIHRYEFSGTGRVAKDSIGGKDGTLQGDAYLDTRGTVQLGQAADDAVELPSRIMAGLTGFTLLGWMDLRAEDCWRRLFDFIYYREGEEGRSGAQGSAFYLTPYACPDSVPRLGYATAKEQITLDGQDDVADRRPVLLGAAYDSHAGVLQLIVDGVVVDEDDVTIDLRELSMARARLGSPTNAEEKRLYGNITEFRIYDHALDAATLAEVAKRGPDQL